MKCLGGPFSSSDNGATFGFAARDRALRTFRAQIMKLYHHPLSATRIVPFVETPVGLSAAA